MSLSITSLISLWLFSELQTGTTQGHVPQPFPCLFVHSLSQLAENK